jgi:flagellar biosynthesis/type III secretory pathway M-ring protein FliF/YscJ
MFTTLAIKTSLKKIWTWIKHYWYVPAVVLYTLLLWFVFGKKDKAHEVLKIREKSLEDQIKIINDSHKEEIELRDEILKKYNDLVTKMEESFKRDEKELEDSKKKEIKKLVENYHNDPEELAKLIAEKYGFEYVE